MGAIARELFSGNRTIIAQLATGGGKTITFSSICQRYTAKTPGKSVLILVHRRELLQQTRATLWSACQILAQPIIAGMKTIPEAAVYVAMVESASKRKDMIRNVGLIIIDEAHIASFAKIHEAYPDTMIIGFTATPLSANKKKPLKNYYQNIVCGIDIPDLIRMGNLCQNITVAPKDSVARASLTIKNGEFDDGIMAMQFSKSNYVKNTVAAYQKYALGNKTIIFNVTIDHSILVTQAFLDAGYECRHLDGGTESEERKKILRWFKETPAAILSNIGILTAGFDEPGIETVIVNKATMSMPLWLQMCGRAARPTDSKSMFKIIDLGANAITHGDWCQPRDWENLFWNPPKAGGDTGVAPVKVCPQCENIIAAQYKTCPNCNYEYPQKEEAEETELGSFVVVTAGIDALQLIKDNKEKKEYYPFYLIGKQLADMAKSTIKKMSDESAEFILSEYDKLAKTWCHGVGKRYNEWHKTRAKEHLYSELEQRFPKWNNPLKNKDNDVIPFNPIISLSPINNLISL